MKWLIVGLSLSLMANAFAAGFYFTRANPPKRVMQAPELSAALPRGTFRVLPQDARAAFRDAFLENRRNNGVIRRQIRDARLRLAELATQPGTLNKAAITNTFTQLRGLQARQQQSFETALIAALETMDEADRKTFAERVLRAKEIRRQRRREGNGGGIMRQRGQAQ
ncbi:MAG: periplasmic heavy metal sensor [Pseudomonadota bacterium]